MKRLGLVGVGAWGQRYKKTIEGRGDCRIAAVARRSIRDESIAPGATVCDDWQALVQMAVRRDLDGVIVATTPENQLEIAVACATQGVPLIVEKPLGLSQADVERVRSSLIDGRARAPFLVDYVHLWSPAYRDLRRLVDEAGGPPAIVGIEMEGCNRGPLRSFSSLYDYGPHDVSMALELVGGDAAFRLIDAASTRSDSAGHCLYEVQLELGRVPVHMRVGNGATAKSRRVAVTVGKGRQLVYDDTRQHPFKLCDGDAPVPVAPTPPLDAVLAAFLEMIDIWKRGAWVPEGRALALSARVNEILDSIAAKVR